MARSGISTRSWLVSPLPVAELPVAEVPVAELPAAELLVPVVVEPVVPVIEVAAPMSWSPFAATTACERSRRWRADVHRCRKNYEKVVWIKEYRSQYRCEIYVFELWRKTDSVAG